MSIFMPRAKRSDRIKTAAQTVFGGINHNASARDGEIYDMKNMSSDAYPFASSRSKRYFSDFDTYTNIFNIGNDIYTVYKAGKKYSLMKNSTPLDDRYYSENIEQIVKMGHRILIFPQKRYIDTDGSNKDLESICSGTADFTDGTYKGETAEENTIKMSGNHTGAFEVGDAVEISGDCSEKNKKTAVIREIEYSGGYTFFRFYEHCFKKESVKAITMKRSVPDMDFVFVHENRLWGFKGSTIYASKLGDPKNFNVFDGLSTDSYALEVLSAGNFTAAISYLGYPLFFKEDAVYKVYGSKPSDFQVIGSARLGVAEKSGKSPAVANETLFYLSRSGVCAYKGGIPSVISAPLGDGHFSDGVGGSDGKKYYISMKDAGGTHRLYVYDTAKGLWHAEDNTKATAFAKSEAFYMLADGKLYSDRETELSESEEADTDIDSCLEFAPSAEGLPQRKGISKLLIRFELEAGASVTVKFSADGGEYIKVGEITAAARKSCYLPIIPRRCDNFKLRIEGKGRWRLLSLAKQYYSGSELL